MFIGNLVSQDMSDGNIKGKNINQQYFTWKKEGSSIARTFSILLPKCIYCLAARFDTKKVSREIIALYKPINPPVEEP